MFPLHQWCHGKSLRPVVVTDMLQLQQFIPNVFCQVEVRNLCRPVKFLYTKLSHLCLYRPCLVQSCWKWKGTLLTVPTRLGAWNRKRTSHHNPPPQPPPNFRFGTMQSGNYICHCIYQTQTHQLDCWRGMICRTRESTSTELEYRGRMLFTPVSNALHCTLWCKACIQLLDRENSFNEVLYTL